MAISDLRGAGRGSLGNTLVARLAEAGYIAHHATLKDDGDAFIAGYHDRANGGFAPLTIRQTEVCGGYRPSPADTRGLDEVMNGSTRSLDRLRRPA